MRRDITEEGWLPARLIPVAGIRGQEEQERRATSALLAVMVAVPAFGRALLSDVGAPRGRIRTYAEVPLLADDGRTLRPDGVVVVERGSTRWGALVEVKTGGATLAAEQVSSYLDIARDRGFDAVVTISNQIRRDPTDVPFDVDKRKLRRTRLRHLSWWRILTEAIVQHRHRGVEDPDQAWLLGELIAYLDHPRSGAGGFEDMGSSWVAVREAARHDAINPRDPAAIEVVGRWQQLVEYLCLTLSQDLGAEVTSVTRRGRDSDARAVELTKSLAEQGTLSGSMKVPDAAGPITVTADLRARRMVTSVTLAAPKDAKRPLTAIRWMLRQLADAPGDLKVAVSFQNVRHVTAALLDEARQREEVLLCAGDPRRLPRSFTLSVIRALGTKRGRGERTFVGETRRQTIGFYRDIVQNLKPWTPKPPRMPREVEEDGDETVRAHDQADGAVPATAR